jgi:hypothetical protein
MPDGRENKAVNLAAENAQAAWISLLHLQQTKRPTP